MTVLQFIFYAFSGIAVFSGMLVVGSTNPVRGALFLVLTFFAMSGLWILLHAEFLALILVLVYVGAVMTLFLFVVMMLSINRVSRQEGFVSYLPLCIVMVLTIVGLIIMVVGPKQYGLAQIALPVLSDDVNNMASLGAVLYTEYAFPFEVAAVLLLTGIVAAISLTHSPGKKHKSQRVSAQIAVNSRDRVRLVDLPSSPKAKPGSIGP